MRVSKEKAAENREKILTAAARLMRERGIARVGVEELSTAAGMTQGSLYSQFGSKDALAAEAVRFALDINAENAERAQDLKTYLDGYLSDAHRNRPGKGCVLAALGGEMPQCSPAVRSGYTTGLRRMVDRISELIRTGQKRRREDEALVTVATMVGALILSRAVDDPEFSGRILEVSRQSLTKSRD